VSVHSLSDPSLSSMRARLRTAALNLLTAFWRSPVRQYRPEAHYVRGPGSKWSEKHGRNREARVSSGDRKFLNGSRSIGSQKHRSSHVIATDATWKLSADLYPLDQICARRTLLGAFAAPVNYPRRAAVPAASCSRTPSIHQKPIPIFQMTGGTSSNTII
jgi:hypothetical protein